MLSKDQIEIFAERFSFYIFSLPLMFLPRRAAVLHFVFGMSHSHQMLRNSTHLSFLTLIIQLELDFPEAVFRPARWL